ncbi:polycomb group RING finger protein 3 isoform X1 [Sarcophilus harrisii]|uniref:Polycomb group ring finger 3 n=1 Tax=Sarcophilus harrisii TaxID=9305 RepID=G3WCA4_SARHA|nr:polycomb group RING finger protein 3 isoform X1 [Sarcophilus harrisii]XP_031798246.1 polycomb group RING finger protein 3 isoform X1 [Sarcophilus harrisii]XP_031798247.1 polycomb group RING finger protein 3 isoform X1 [Sarcophilus harrisii]XP_031798248.1 polycomb group RING finger protein 3 isoform X1 [Sarcophilus harrisii]XP_031798249.1 polycomb group RING finger protein 3 isoform X1 [Sarcophilus harrisii]XP_031798250.1 polycomb group RING finger protein 3 isoform X1 [Sarcophilus harrisii]
MLTRKIKLWDINAHITCRLCNGYLIDATTVTECLHTFCRSCLVKYLEENNTCPTCRIVIHQSHPLQYIGHDRTMQDIVYKLVPGLQEAEMRKQREFYHKLGMEVPGDIKGETCSAKQHLDSHRNGETKADDNSNKETSEEKQEEDNDYHRSDEQVSICLECNSSKLRGLKRKWIRCSAQATVLHLKKFIAKKLNLSSFNEGAPALTLLLNLGLATMNSEDAETQRGPAITVLTGPKEQSGIKHQGRAQAKANTKSQKHSHPVMEQKLGTQAWAGSQTV